MHHTLGHIHNKLHTGIALAEPIIKNHHVNKRMLHQSNVCAILYSRKLKPVCLKDYGPMTIEYFVRLTEYYLTLIKLVQH